MALQLTASSRPPYAGPPLPPDEDERVGALRTLHIEEGQADPVLDSLCNLVCSLLKVRIAGVSIVERDRQFYKALSTGHEKITIPRAWSFCQYTFLPKLPSVLVVEDAAQDARFDEHPLVVGQSALPIRFYAGAPLITSSGHRIGAMCLVDTQPRRLTVDDYRVLNNCAEMVVRRLEAERFAVAHAGAAHTLLRSLEAFKRGVLLCDMAARGWRILYANEAWSKATGLKQVNARQYTLWDLYAAADESQDAAVAGFREAVAAEQPFSLAMQLRSAGARAPVLRMVFRPAMAGALDPFAVEIGVPDDVIASSVPACDQPFYFVTVQSEDAGVRAAPGAPAAPALPAPPSPQPGGAPAAAAPAAGAARAAAPPVQARGASGGKADACACPEHAAVRKIGAAAVGACSGGGGGGGHDAHATVKAPPRAPVCGCTIC